MDAKIGSAAANVYHIEAYETNRAWIDRKLDLSEDRLDDAFVVGVVGDAAAHDGLVVFAGLTVVLGVESPRAQRSHWPQRRGPSRDGTAPGATLPGPWPKKLCRG